MKNTKTFIVSLIIVVAQCGLVGYSAADQLRYMDEAGNIRFVNRMKEVPREYREQIVPPTPRPKLDARQLSQVKRKQEEEQRRREQELAKRQKNEKLRRDELEKQRLKLERESLQLSGLDRVQRLGR